MQQKVVLCLALVCLAALPLFNARSLLEEGDLAALATAALESGKAMTAEESMLMQASGGAYGAGAMAGGYGNSAGGILDTTTTPAADAADATPAASSTGLEAGDGTTSSTPAAAKPAATKSAASSPAAKSTGLVVAGAVVFLSAFLL